MVIPSPTGQLKCIQYTRIHARVKVLLASTALLTLVGRCHNHTIWQQKSLTAIQNLAVPNFKSEIFHYHITADVSPAPSWFGKDLNSEKEDYDQNSGYS